MPPYAGPPSVVLRVPSPLASSASAGHSCRASAPKWMCAACGWSASSPFAAIVTVRVVPSTLTIAEPPPWTPLRATGLRFALASPSAADAAPRPTGRSIAAPIPARAIRRVVRMVSPVRAVRAAPIAGSSCGRRGFGAQGLADGAGLSPDSPLPAAALEVVRGHGPVRHVGAEGVGDLGSQRHGPVDAAADLDLFL